MHQPLFIGNVHNMSFYSSSNEQPQLLAWFSCENITIRECIIYTMDNPNSPDVFCCAAIWIYDSQIITVKGISIEPQTSAMSGITLHNVSNLKLQLATALIPPASAQSKQIGILISGANVVEVSSSYAAHYSYGFVFHYVHNILITNITAIYNSYRGICLYGTTNTTIISPKVMNNRAGMWLFSDTNTEITNTNTTIIDAIVVHNDAYGMDLNFISDTTIINPTVLFNGKYGITIIECRNTSIINATVRHNTYGGIIMATSVNILIINIQLSKESERSITVGYIVIISSLNTTISNSSFAGIGAAPNAAGGADPTSHPAVLVLLYSKLYISACKFTENSISAVKAHESSITAAGDLIFSSNTAMAGTAFVLVQNSILRLEERSHILFRNNHAINTGGAFYVTNNADYGNSHPIFVQAPWADTYSPFLHPLLRSTCFLSTEGSRSQVMLTFMNNSAGKGGDILYGGDVAYGLDGDWNCLLSFRNVSNISQNGLSLITSDPSRVCLCNGTGQPDCLTLAEPTTHVIYPGQSFHVSAVLVGQEFGAVSGSVYAQFLYRPESKSSLQLDTWQTTQDVTQEKCNSLKYTTFSKENLSNAVLALTAAKKEIPSFMINTTFTEIDESFMRYYYETTHLDYFRYTDSPVYINISILPCPSGFTLTNESPFRCECNQLLQSVSGVECHIQEQTIGRSGLVWVGILKDDNETVAASEYCSYDYCNNGDRNVTLDEPDSQCNYNHSGTLCGGCQPGLSLALGSAQCLQCSNKYLSLLIPFALAGPALVFLIKLLDLTLSQGTLNGLIFYANIVKANEYIYVPQRHTNPLTLFIAWLNLDVGVETCFFHGLTAYTKTWLQFVFPIYIWTIAGLIIIIAKHSDRVAKVMGNNSVPVLATLFLLSYAKLFRTIITALSYTMLYSSQGHKAVWSADGNVDYLGPKHAPLFAVAVAALLFLWLPYTLLLFLGQWLHRCNCQLIDHILMRIKPFLDAHYGSLKGKHHYWFGVLLLVRAVILLMSALIPANHSVIVNFCVSVSATVLIFLGMLVHQNIVVAMFDVSFIMNLALLSVATMFTTMVRGDQTVAACTLIAVAFVQFVGLVLFKLLSSILKRNEKLMVCLHKRKPVEDDWELYEEAALLRERESNTEEEDSEVSGSIETISSY